MGTTPLALPEGKEEGCQTACKPGSVRAGMSPCRRWTAIPLGRALRHASRDQPGRQGGNAPASPAHDFPCAGSPAAPIRSCSRWGLPCRPRHRGRGALLPHRFTHACCECSFSGPFGTGGLFSVALSLGSPPPAVSRHRISVEPGLSSNVPDVTRVHQRPSSRLAGRGMRGRGRQVNAGGGQPGR